MKNFRILVVDDEKLQRETLAEILRDNSYEVETAEGISHAQKLITEKDFHVVLTDYRMPGGTGIDLARFCSQFHPSTSILLMTAYAEVQGVIDAMRLGALDYLLKPIDVNHLLRQMAILQEQDELRREVHFLRRELDRKAPEKQWLLGDSQAITNLRSLLSQVSQTKGTVLITGESGTGKEMAARHIHATSAQKNQKFVAINCGAIPEQLLESELFGHKKGSFTGAVSDKTGLFAVASGGTLFLDEIGELPKGLQVKILRALQEREIVPVGDINARKIDVRVIAATNRNLASDVQQGLFRNDLFYRINVVEVTMPPLREHPEDIASLTQHFILKCSKELGKSVLSISNDALRKLKAYSWPGNVRELENVIERAIILSRTGTVIEVCDLPPGFQELDEGEGAGRDLEAAIRTFSRSYITLTLNQCGGDKKEAARILGVGLSSLYRKLEELGLSSKRTIS